MMKRIIALLLALILTVGLLPTVALAADGENPTTDSGSVTKEASKDNLNLVKTVTKEGDNYKVTLESWATGTVTTTTETKPLDIVLLLDVSGSMDEKYSNETIDKYVPYDYSWHLFGGYNTTNSDLKKYEKTQYGVWYKLSDGTYVTVKVEVEERTWKKDIYTYSYASNGKTTIIERSLGANDPPTTQFYYKEAQNTTKLDALKTAVSAFIDNVATNSPNSNISIVKFADDRYKDTEGNDSYSNGYNYTQIVKKLTKVDTEGVTALKRAVSGLKAGGATASDYGLNKAAEALKDAKQERVVILFTDGEPNYHSGFDKEVATNAVNKAKELKTATTKTTIYTVGVFKNLYEDVNLYMSSVSSNYPNASAQYNNKKNTWTVSGGGSDFGKYYMNATNPVDLLKAFQTISSEVSGGELGAEAVLTDVIAPNFALVAPVGTIGVTAYTVDKTADGWSTQKTTLTNGVTVGTDGQVNVTGFDYSENCVTTTAKPNTTNDYGKKLVVEFTIHHNNYGGTQPTNAGASIKDKENKDVITVDNPSVPVTITEPSITGVTRSKVYDGTGFDVLSTIAEDINALADGKKNAYVDIVVTVTSGSNTYTYTISKGATTGSWDKTGLTTDKDVKIENDAVSSYVYDLTITFKDATANGAAAATKNATATYTITKRPVTLTSGSDEKKYDGTPLTKHEVTASTDEGVGFVGEDRATYTFTGSQTEPGESDNEFEYTLIGETKATNYEITKQLGKLKVTQDDTEITVTITGKQETKEYNGQTQEVVGFTYTVEGAAHDDVTVSLKTGKEAKASGKDVLVGTDGKYDATLTYPMHLTADCFDVSSTKYSNVTIEEVNDGWLKITPIAITLKSSNASKTYDGAALTKKEVTVTSGNFVSDEGLDYNVTGSQTKVGSSKNTYTYTAKAGTTLTNYTIIKEEGDLTVTLPDLTALPNVTVNCVNTEVPAHTEKNTSLTNTNHYTVSTEATKVDGQNAYTRTITLTEAGKNHFISSEYVPEYGSHTPATTGNVTEITMTYSEENGVWAWRASHTNFLLNVECTTPTTTVDLGTYVKKTLTGTNFHENFSAEFKVDVAYSCDGNKTATGSVTLTGAAVNKPFTFSNITLKQGFYYIFTVREQKANVPGVTCDTTTYEFALNVKTDGNVEFGSVVDKQFVPAGAEADQFLTITNTYTEPTYAVEKSVINDDASDNIPDSLDRDIYQYPTNGKFIVEKTYTDDTITFLYVIEVSGKNGAEMTIQEKDGGKFISVDYSTETRATINPNAAQDTYTVKLTADVDASDPIKLYAEKTFHKDADGKFPTTATNALLVNGKDGPKDNTTIEERGTLTVDFGALVHKHLTVTGDKSFNGATFTVNFTEGLYAPLAVNNSIEVYADAGVGKEKLPDLTASVTYTADERNRGLKDFDGADLTINTEGNYSYIVSEQIPAGATGYDTKKYVVGIVVVPDGDGLKVEHVWYHELVEDLATHPEIIPGGPTFHNTIDTGKDDYYPIIIPTIINKDTGMLNKTDHFAYVIGYPDGTVHPNGQITRAEVATIFFRLLRDEVRDGAFTTSNSYSDVAYGKWYNNPISTMSALGIITGYPDGTFKPNKPITRAEFAAIAARFDETQSGKSATFSDVIGHWAAREIGIAYYNDWIKGYPDGTFKPDQNITRAEAMTLINRVLERKPESPADLLTNMNKWTDNMDTSKWYYLDVQEATNSHGYTRKTFNYELWRQMLPDPDWSRYER